MSTYDQYEKIFICDKFYNPFSHQTFAIQCVCVTQHIPIQISHISRAPWPRLMSAHNPGELRSGAQRKGKESEQRVYAPEFPSMQSSQAGRSHLLLSSLSVLMPHV